jgi:hypothetical protein
MSEQSRAEALDKSVRITLACGGSDETELILDRAQAFYEFLEKGYGLAGRARE